MIWLHKTTPWIVSLMMFISRQKYCCVIDIVEPPTLLNSNYHYLLSVLTHWDRVTHICVGNLTITGSDNDLSPGRCQAIIRTNAGILSIGLKGTNFSEIWIGMRSFSFKKMHLKRSSEKWQPFCLGLNMSKCYCLQCWWQLVLLL